LPAEVVVNSVLGTDVAAAGAVLMSESIFAVMPGADLVPEVTIDRAEVFQTLRRALEDFRVLGGGTIVDLGGLTTGRDAEQLALLSEVTGIQIIASTGFGPVWTVGSHFTNNVSEGGMTVDRIADIFRREITEGLLAPPRERTDGRAGIVSLTAAPNAGPFEADVFRAGARAAVATGSAVSVRVVDDAAAALAIVEDEGVDPGRVIVGGLDRRGHLEAGLPLALAERGYVVGLDHVGWPEQTGYAAADARVSAVLDLFERGLGDRVIVSSSAIGVAVELPAPVNGDFGGVLRDFVPALRAAGGTDAHVTQLLETTPRRLLGIADTIRED